MKAKIIAKFRGSHVLTPCPLPSALCWSCLLFISLFASETHAQGAGRRQVLEGNRHYAEGKYDEANNSYRDAQIDNPESPIIHFNIGDVQYQKRNYEEALKVYHEAIQKSNDKNLQAQAYYNIGNALYRLNKWPESVMAYQQALKLNPNDEDAKFNLEYVRAQIKQNSQKDSQQQQQQQQQNQQQQSENQQNQNQDQQNEQQQQQEQQSQEQNQPQDQKQQEQSQQQNEQAEGQQMKEGKLSKEDAERLLEALQNQEKEAQKKRQAKVGGRIRVDKDW
jgi:tetratricopeptide (TPR) repeat protein